MKRTAVFLLSVLLALLGCSPAFYGADVKGTLTLTVAQPGEPYYIRIENDAYGIVAETTGTCGATVSVSYSMPAVFAGIYYIHAWIDVGNDGYPDYEKYYGVSGLSPPSVPNAAVPTSGEVTFDIAF